MNNALDVIRKAERGEKIEYSSLKNEQQINEMQSKMPKHYFVADEIAKHPDSEKKFVVIVRDKENKSVDVVLPAGASLEVNNEVSGMSKQRIEHALQKEGFSLSSSIIPMALWATILMTAICRKGHHCGKIEELATGRHIQDRRE